MSTNDDQKGDSITIEKDRLNRIVAICNDLALREKFYEDDLEISKFKSGFMSEIYRVTFKKPRASLPPAVVVKFYNTTVPKEESGFEIVNSQVNNLLIGQAGLGPKILLIRPDAIVMEFVASEQLNEDHDQDPKIREDVARNLARLHSLPAPISRNQHSEVIHQLFNVWMTPELIDNIYKGELRKYLEQLNLPYLLANDLRTETEFVHDAIVASEPTTTLVFSHCDFNHLNLLVAPDPVTQKPAVRFIDFDFCTYFFRGADIGRYFVDCKQPEQFHQNELIPDAEILQFIEWYRDENAKIHGETFLKEPQNSPELMLKEAKLFSLYAFVVDIVFCIYMAVELKEKDHEKMIEFLKHGDKRYSGYLKAKARFLKDGSLP